MASGGDEPVSDTGGGEHSVFAGALLRGLTQTSKEQFTAAELFLDYISESVAGRADQTPEYSPLRNSGHESGDFVFVRLKPTGSATMEGTVNAPTTAMSVDSSAIELAFWDAIKNSNDPGDYKEYLKKYPNGQFAGIAERRMVLHPPAVGAAASSDFSGTWILDTNRTTDRSIRGSDSYKITQDAQQIALESEGGGDGLRTRTKLLNATYKLDGTETTTENPRDGRGNRTSFKAQWKDGGKTLELRQVYAYNYRGDDMTSTETQDWTLSADGKVLTVQRTVISSRGTQSSTLVFNKQ
jgi:hypothetical protein